MCQYTNNTQKCRSYNLLSSLQSKKTTSIGILRVTVALYIRHDSGDETLVHRRLLVAYKTYHVYMTLV